MGYAPQQAVLFTGTVRSNVSYASDDIEEKVRKAVRIAQAEEFVSQMDGDIDADVTRGGTNVSGGQKQRLSVARAVYREPEFYIFDDTFSALDYKTDRVLRNTLKKETSDGVYVALFPYSPTGYMHFTVTGSRGTYAGMAKASLKAGRYYPATLKLTRQ